MSFDMVRFERGQVWMIRFKYKEQVGHEQDKDRPWLILSVGRYNGSSGMITAVPITTRDAVRYPSQVMFTNDRNTSNIILCEQIRSFDYKSGSYLMDFVGNISNEILEKVDVAISIHLGLHYSPITLQKLYDSMEAIIKSVGYMQQKADTPKFTDDDVLQFAEKLQELATTTDEEETHRDIIEDMDKAYGIINDEVANTKIEMNTTEYERPDILDQDTIRSIEVKTKRIRWTSEKCKEFIHDCNTMPVEDIMSKWGIMKKSRYYSMKNYVLSLLKTR